MGVMENFNCDGRISQVSIFTFFFCRGRQTEKCAKIYNALAQLLFSLLNFLFGDILVAVVVVC